jgi:hypothetical protein
MKMMVMQWPMRTCGVCMCVLRGRVCCRGLLVSSPCHFCCTRAFVTPHSSLVHSVSTSWIVLSAPPSCTCDTQACGHSKNSEKVKSDQYSHIIVFMSNHHYLTSPTHAEALLSFLLI